MFAVKDKRSGKYLRDFSGSYNRKCMYTGFDISDEKGVPYTQNIAEDIHRRLWCLDSPAGAKLYRNIAGIKNSIGDEEWLEIVSIEVVKQ